MRILITSIGDTEIKHNIPSPQSTDNIFKPIKIGHLNPLKKKQLSISTERRQSNFSHSSINTHSIYSVKAIDLKSPKRLILSQISKMYERPIPIQPQTPSPSIIKDHFALPMTLSPAQEQKKHLPLLSIVPDTAVKSLLRNIAKQKEEKKKDRIITINDFRSNNDQQDNNDINQIKDMLNSTKVSLKHSYLINYLSKNENCNPTVFAKVNKAEQDELSKLNKVCQMVLVNRNQDILFKDIIKKKFESKLIKTKQYTKNKMDILKQNMDISSQIIKRYSNKVNKKNAYEDNHYLIEQKYWSKYDFEKLNFKRNQKTDRPISPKQKQRILSHGNIFEQAKTNNALFLDKHDNDF